MITKNAEGVLSIINTRVFLYMIQFNAMQMLQNMLHCAWHFTMRLCLRMRYTWPLSSPGAHFLLFFCCCFVFMRLYARMTVRTCLHVHKPPPPSYCRVTPKCLGRPATWAESDRKRWRSVKPSSHVFIKMSYGAVLFINEDLSDPGCSAFPHVKKPKKKKNRGRGRGWGSLFYDAAG